MIFYFHVLVVYFTYSTSALPASLKLNYGFFVLSSHPVSFPSFLTGSVQPLSAAASDSYMDVWHLWLSMSANECCAFLLCTFLPNGPICLASAQRTWAEKEKAETSKAGLDRTHWEPINMPAGRIWLCASVCLRMHITQCWNDWRQNVCFMSVTTRTKLQQCSDSPLCQCCGCWWCIVSIYWTCPSHYDLI